MGVGSKNAIGVCTHATSSLLIVFGCDLANAYQPLFVCHCQRNDISYRHYSHEASHRTHHLVTPVAMIAAGRGGSRILKLGCKNSWFPNLQHVKFVGFGVLVDHGCLS